MTQEIQFLSNTIRPVECLRQGWKTIKDQYWFFMELFVVGFFFGFLAPMGSLLGPTMCGIYLTLLTNLKGEPVAFKMLLKGFDYFVESSISTLIQIGIGMVTCIPLLAVFLISRIVLDNNQPPPLFYFTLFVVFMLFFYVITLILGILFIFSYPLIVDKKMKGWESIKLSVKAGMANFWGIAGLMGLNLIIGIVGLLGCCLGVFFVMPVNFAAWAVAYRQIFPQPNT